MSYSPNSCIKPCFVYLKIFTPTNSPCFHKVSNCSCFSRRQTVFKTQAIQAVSGSIQVQTTDTLKSHVKPPWNKTNWNPQCRAQHILGRSGRTVGTGTGEHKETKQESAVEWEFGTAVMVSKATNQHSEWAQGCQDKALSFLQLCLVYLSICFFFKQWIWYLQIPNIFWRADTFSCHFTAT